VLLVLVPALNLLPADHPLHLSDYWVTLGGKIMCYAIVALAMDLIWGYAGILSLGHGLFFALGGYAMGMYLMRSIGREGVYQSDLPDFMVFLDWKAYPWYWSFTDHFWYAALLVVLVPGLLAFVFGYFAFRSRIKGVYFSIITQALTYAFMLLFFRNDTGFGGNNGFTDFKRILGYPIAAPGTRVALFIATGVALLGALLLARYVVTSKLGRVLTAIRDAESRVMFCGYSPLHYKLFVWTLSAVLCGIAGRAVRPPGRHHQPERDVARELDRDRDLGCGRGTRHADRPDRRGVPSSTAQRAGSRRHSPSTGCSSSACCSFWSRCSCRTASSAFCAAAARRPQRARDERSRPFTASTAGRPASRRRACASRAKASTRRTARSCTSTASRSASTASRR
jgi:urea ABC transporter permease protein UrtC